MKIDHDVHIHNFLSSCSNDNCATVESYIEISKKQGLSIIGFANHTWDESVPLPKKPFEFYRHQSLTFQQQIKAQIPERVEGLRVLVGAETEYCGMYDCLGMSVEGAKKLDFVLIPHTHVHMRDFVMPSFEDTRSAQENIAKKLEQIDWLPKGYAMTMACSLPREALEPFITAHVDRIKIVSDFMVQSFRSLMNNETLKGFERLVPVSVAHPFQPVNTPGRLEMMKLISDNTFGALFSIAAERGIGLEINPWTCEEDFRMFGIAKECGCKFTLGSDAHARASLNTIFGAQALVDRLELSENDLMSFVRSY